MKFLCGHLWINKTCSQLKKHILKHDLKLATYFNNLKSHLFLVLAAEAADAEVGVEQCSARLRRVAAAWTVGRAAVHLQLARRSAHQQAKSAADVRSPDDSGAARGGGQLRKLLHRLIFFLTLVNGK
jgi:hypothetical protein